MSSGKKKMMTPATKLSKKDDVDEEAKKDDSDDTEEEQDKDFGIIEDKDFGIIKATVNSRRSGKVAGHYIGIDCCRREFIDTFLKQRRPMSEQQWAAIGVVDWQATYLICTTR